MEKEKLTVIIPSYQNLELLENAVSSFYYSLNENFDLSCVVIENAGVERTIAFDRFNDLTWIKDYTQLEGSYANAKAIIDGLKIAKTKWIFFAHNDVFVTGKAFYDSMYSKIKEGFRVVGVCRDSIRIKALHISGLLVDRDIFREGNIDLMPNSKYGANMDVGDDITRFCRSNAIKHFCFNNSYNDSSLVSKAPPPFDMIVSDKCFDEERLIYVHLGRGTSRVKGTYHKANRATIEEWLKACKSWQKST